ncbi:YtxH domain-containing protein [Paenibacillus donghaensis]|uniref:Gas vesicle protein n=1 Tax=Paenibacillus donghaensis TaxID=414771 RepID=A0A2Z2KL23_9BACL|nr:YtxH domain-containing protein [Paenibacillus donghaensis]ASA20621.1 hypothetical protein B9T62_07325 [Paenibacillus donghaensis]
MKKDSKGLLWGLLAGGILGSVTALLFAPKPGKALRQDIAEGTAAGVEKVQELAAQASDKGVEIYDKAKDTALLVVSEVKEWTNKCTIDTDEEVKLAVSGIDEAAEEVAADEAEAGTEEDGTDHGDNSPNL